MGCLAWQSLTVPGRWAASKNRRWGAERSLTAKGLTPGPVSHSAPPHGSLCPKPWVFPLPPLLVTGPCFLPEIKGLSTEIPQEGGWGDTASPQGLPEAPACLSFTWLVP